MRHYILALPILALSACSVIEQPNIPSNSGTNSGQYSQGCSTGACAPGQSYSVAGQHPSAQARHGAYQGDWSGQNGGAYGQGPVHVNPTGYNHNGYGSQQAQGYGQPPRLRGRRGQERGNFYGTVGGVWYDTDVDSFGLQGRLGYDSGRGFLGATYGVEVEGSVGLNNESGSDFNGITDISSGFDTNIGAYVVSRLPLTKRLSLLSRAGYNSQELTIRGTLADGTRDEEDFTLDGFSYGFGAEYALTPQSGLRIDYTETDTDFGGSTHGLAASFTRKF